MAVTMLLAALALVAWPAVPAALGGLALVGPSRSGVGRAAAVAGVAHRHPRMARAAVAAVAAAFGALVSVPCGLALAIAVATGIRLVTRARSVARSRADLADATAALRALARELRAGANGPDAIERTARSVPPRIAAALRGSASGGQGGTTADDDSVLGEITRRLTCAGTLSAIHGVPLGSVVDAMAGDLSDRAQIAEATAAQVAGPAMSGYVLAALPIAGLLLGAGMSTDPIAVLTGSAIGGALLVIGTLLCCAGLLWADRIVRG